MNADLKRAWGAALNVPRHEARQRALDFSWKLAARQFADYLVPARGDPGVRVAWDENGA